MSSADRDVVVDGNIHLWQRAASLAARCHAGQLRKDGCTPYITHPYRVAMVIREIFGVDDPVILAAALLHDVIEDSPADYDDIAQECGTEVADYVACMTKDMRMVESEREEAYDRQLTAGPWQARLVKLADVYDNICDSAPGASRRKTTSKAPRAIACAGNDPRLSTAIRIVQELVDKMGEFESARIQP